MVTVGTLSFRTSHKRGVNSQDYDLDFVKNEEVIFKKYCERSGHIDLLACAGFALRNLEQVTRLSGKLKEYINDNNGMINGREFPGIFLEVQKDNIIYIDQSGHINELGKQILGKTKDDGLVKSPARIFTRIRVKNKNIQIFYNI